MRTLRCDLHNHVSQDAVDPIRHTATQLIHQAKNCGIDAIAITPHQQFFNDPDAAAYGKTLGILVINGAELILDGVELLLLNFPPEVQPEITSLDRLKKIRADPKIRETTFVIAPHPYYPTGKSIGDKIKSLHPHLDALEDCYFHGKVLGIPINPFNLKAATAAHNYRLPLIANSDTHHLDMHGENFTEVAWNGERLTPTSLFHALRTRTLARKNPPMTLKKFKALCQQIKDGRDRPNQIRSA
jgi:predicted metal-dependent phosphoesterase TrpH